MEIKYSILRESFPEWEKNRQITFYNFKQKQKKFALRCLEKLNKSKTIYENFVFLELDKNEDVKRKIQLYINSNSDFLKKCEENIEKESYFYNLEKVSKIENKIKKLLPCTKNVNTENEEFQQKISAISSPFEYKIDLKCDFDGTPLIVYKTRFHDGSHQYNESWFENISTILQKEYVAIRIGTIKRCYSKTTYEKNIIPIIQKNKNIIKTYLLFESTRVL